MKVKEAKMEQKQSTTTGYRTKTITVNGCKVILHKPELDAGTYEKRKHGVERALALFKRGGVTV